METTLTHTRFQSFAVSVLLASIVAFAAPVRTALAADGSWNVNTAGQWSAIARWLGGVIPGSTTATNSADIATFGFTLTAGRTVTVDANRNIGGIIFSNTSAFGYTLSTGPLLLTNGGVIQSATNNGAHSDTISAPIVIQGSGGSGTFTAGATNAASLLSMTGTVTGVSTAGNTTTLTLNGSNTGANAITGVIGNGSVGGSLAIVKDGSGVWRLGGVNTFSGGVTLNAGTLQLGNNAALGTGTFTIDGGAIDVTAALATTNNNAQNWNGDFTFVGSNTLNLGTGAVAMNASRTVTVNASTLTVGGVISGAGFSLTKNGTGTLTLSGSNTFSGGLTVNAGIVSSGNARGFGAGTITLGDTSGSNNARLDLTSGITYANNITVQAGSSGTMSIFGNANSSQTLSGDILLNRNVEVGQVISSGQSVTLSGSIGGTGGLIVSAGNVGQVRLTGSTTFSGGVTVNAGSLTLGNAGTINVNYTGPTTINGGTLIVAVSGTFDKDVTNNGTLQIPDGPAQTLSGVISGSGNLIYSGVASRSNVITGTDNSYTGRTDITSSVQISKLADLGVNSSLGAPTSVANGTINLNSTNSSSARINYVGPGDTSNRVINFLNTSNSNEIASNGSGPLVLTSNLTTSGGAKTLILSGTNTGNNTIQGIIPDGTGATSLTKDGAGTWVLTGSNSYTGGSTLSAGTLVVGNDDALSSGTISLGGGTLQSTADRTFTNAAVITAASTISGSSSITFSTGNFTNSGGSRTLTNNLDAGKSLTFSGTTFLQESGTGVGRTLTIAGTGNTIFSGPIVNGGTAGSSNLTVTGNVELSGSNSFNVTAIGSGGRVQIASLTNLGTGALQFNVSSGSTATLALRADGSATFAKDPSASSGNIRGTMAFNVDRATPDGPTGGTITFGNGGSVGMDNDSGGLLVTGSNGYGLTLNNNLSWAGQNQTNVPNITNNAPGLLTINGNLVGQSLNARSFEFAGTGDTLVTGSMTGASYYVNKTSAGTLTFSNSVSASAGYRVATGTLTLTGSGSFANGQLQVVSGLIDLNGRSMSTASSTPLTNATTLGGGAAGTTATIATGTGTLTLTTNVTYSATNNPGMATISGNLSLGSAARIFTVNDSSATANDLTISAAIVSSGVSGLTKAGAGTLVLSASNSYEGTTTASAGDLLLDHANALPGGIGSTGGSSGLTINGGVIGLGAGDFTRRLGTGTNQVQITTGGGFAAFNADRVVNLGGAGAGITWGSGSFITTGTSFTLGSADATHTVDFQNPIALGTAARTIVVNNGGATVDARLSGALSSTTGTGGLIKTGAGTLELTAINTYSGTTAVSAGRFLVSGSGNLSSTARVVVDGSDADFRWNSSTAYTRPLTLTQGTISGTGTISSSGGVTIGTNAILSPGNSPGLQSYTTGLTWAAGGTYLWEINNWTGSAGTAYDQIAVSGSPLDITATNGSPFTILVTSLTGANTAGNVPNFDGSASRTFTIATSSAGIMGFDASKFTLDTSGFTNTYTGNWSLSATGSTVLLNYTTGATTTSGSYSLAVATNAATIIAGGSAAITATVTNTGAGTADALNYGSLAVGNGVSISPASGSNLAQGLSGTGAGVFTTSTPAVYTFNPTASVTNATLGGDAVLSGSTATSVTVLDHATSSLDGLATLTSSTISLGSWDYQSQVWTIDTGTGSFSIFNLNPNELDPSLVALLNLTGTSAIGDAGFTLSAGLTPGSFAMIAGGTSTAYSVSFDPTGLSSPGTFTRTFTFQMADQNLPGGQATNTLSVTAAVIVVPEPGAIALAGVGIAAAAWAYRRRRS